MYRGATIWARKTVESDVFFLKPDKWFKIWFFLVSKVNHEDKGNFKRGETLVRYSDIMEACGATKSQVDHSIRWFKKCQMLATRKATRGMFVTVLKYNTYQNLDSYKSDSSGDLEAKPKRNGSDTINKNEKNEKNEKKKEYSEDSDEFRLANYLFNHIQKRKPDFKKPNLQAWAKNIDLMIRIDKRDTERIKKVIAWCQDDDFWQNNILSTTKLRKHFDKLELQSERKTISAKGQKSIDFSQQKSAHGVSFSNLAEG